MLSVDWATITYIYTYYIMGVSYILYNSLNLPVIAVNQLTILSQDHNNLT